MSVYASRLIILRNTQLYALRPTPRIFPKSIAVRFSSTETISTDIRTKLRDDLKQSMRSKDSFRTTTIRSVLAEITNADKANKGAPIAQDTIYSLIQKSIARRNDSATQFRTASRSDLASKEEQESELLSSFLPPQLSDSEIEQKLQAAFATLGATSGNVNPNALVGKLMKSFYETTERASVKADAVSKKAKEIIQAAAKS
ncbi:hypothetical protein FRC12_004577 [Ceratobasidium sp. 428]|nr:hypothetical protein FRC12_004577 [Ceratobasidium sp. 428]